MSKRENNNDEDRYTDFVPVEKMHNEIIPEELPEGPYGSPVNKRLGKSTPFGKDQKALSGYAYENRVLHQNLPRQYPGDHHTHDEDDIVTEKPYNDVR